MTMTKRIVLASPDFRSNQTTILREPGSRRKDSISARRRSNPHFMANLLKASAVISTVLLTLFASHVYTAAIQGASRVYTYTSHQHHEMPGKSQSEIGTCITHGSVPQEGSIKITSTVYRTGPLHISGAVSSSGPVTLKHNLTVTGDIRSASSVILAHHVTVGRKVKSYGDVHLSHSVEVKGSVYSEGNALLEEEVRVGKWIKCKGGLKMKGMVEVGNGEVYGDVEIGLNAEAVFSGKLKVHGLLDVEGRLHVKGNLDVRGSVSIGLFGVLIVDGHESVGGSFNHAAMKN